MKNREVTFGLVLDSPAFLGNALQRAEWRVPPLKALLRQMWRIASAKSVAYDHRRLAERERRLFGAASGTQGQRSLVEIALGGDWSQGKMSTWPKQKLVPHPEVNGGKSGIESHLYLGYGPLRSGGLNKGRTALQPASDADPSGVDVRLRFPGDIDHELLLDDVLGLVHAIGTIGGRSRNGWGSLRVQKVDGLDVPSLASLAQPQGRKLLEKFALLWEECLQRHWTHAVGIDKRHGLLLWRTKSARNSWVDVMTDLAKVKIAVRADKAGSHDKLAPDVRHGEHVPERHVLAYPVTNHPVASWENFRMPNQLRFKVVREPDGNSYRGYIFHLPWLPPGNKVGRDLAKKVWAIVHEKLDALCERSVDC